MFAEDSQERSWLNRKGRNRQLPEITWENTQCHFPWSERVVRPDSRKKPCSLFPLLYSYKNGVGRRKRNGILKIILLASSLSLSLSLCARACVPKWIISVNVYLNSLSVILDLVDLEGQVKNLPASTEEYASEYVTGRETYILIRVDSKFLLCRQKRF